MQVYRGFIMDEWTHLWLGKSSCNGKVITGDSVEDLKRKIDDYFDLDISGYV